jgi:hypothetical protein
MKSYLQTRSHLKGIQSPCSDMEQYEICPTDGSSGYLNLHTDQAYSKHFQFAFEYYDQ